MTLGGESAGGVYSHALSILGTPAKRVILQSGTLPLAPPAPFEKGEALRQTLETFVRKGSGQSLEDAPVDIVVQGLEEMQLRSIWLELTPEFEGWQAKMEDVEELMLGDCEFEVKHPIPCAFVV